ncbi:MAG: hypothetical protein K1X51_14455 [Rhodospirillaceae bacterium]|nr:hypothetical protein [Rhodospirillaceae bacterium]
MTEASDLGGLQSAVQKVERAVRDNAQALQADIAANAEAKKHRTLIDDLEDKVMAQTAAAAAASGTPEQAREMLAKARSKALRAAADGADTGVLDAMVFQMAHLAKVAEENRERERRGGQDRSALAIPLLQTLR